MKNKAQFTLSIIFLIILVTTQISAQCNDCNKCGEAIPAFVKKGKEIKNSAKDNTAGEAVKIENISDDKSGDTASDSIIESRDDEFSAPGDEFNAPEDEFETSSEMVKESKSGPAGVSGIWGLLKIPLIALFLTALAGIFVRFEKTRKLRSVFLVSSLIFFGFYNTGCPCPIMSFQSAFLLPLGTADIYWTALVWFIGLIPLTYLFGKVWCGWVCHLGALQEFLFKPLKLEFLKGERAQKTMKIIRYILLAALIIQVLITKTNLFYKIDPFRAIFNLGYNLRVFEAHTQLIVWSLVGLLILTSLFINRPFCRSACPIGIVLGWISRIPGASVLAKKDGACTGCTLCNKACDYQAINRKNGFSTLRNDDCMSCGECLDSCKTDGIGFARKGINNKNTVILSKELQ